jgi:hypothetical protein
LLLGQPHQFRRRGSSFRRRLRLLLARGHIIRCLGHHQAFLVGLRPTGQTGNTDRSTVPDQAEAAWREALELYRRQGRDEQAQEVERQLDTLEGDESSPGGG